MRTFTCSKCSTLILTSGLAPGAGFTCPTCGTAFQPKRRRYPMPNRSKALVWIAAGAGGLATLVIVLAVLLMRERAGGSLIPGDAIRQRIAAHPWWRVPMTADRASGIVGLVMKLQRDYDSGRDRGNLHLTSDGRVDYLQLEPAGFDDGFVPPGFNRTTGVIPDGGESVSILFQPGPRRRSHHLNAAEASDLVLTMLDRAHASEEKFRKTGKGDGILDQFMNMQIPVQAENEARRLNEERDRANAKQQGNGPAFPALQPDP